MIPYKSWALTDNRYWIAAIGSSAADGRIVDSPVEKREARLMRAMFGAIAPRYDFITRVFSYGMDQRWKRLAVRRAPLPKGAVVLDLACGTGDFSQIVSAAFPGSRVIAVDLTPSMLSFARQRSRVEVVCGDAMALPFADGAFDCVFIGYGLRNFPDLATSLGRSIA